MTIKFTYYGHATFMLEKDNIALVCDPFFTGNTWNKATKDDINCQYIFVSHAHDDHYGDTDYIAKKNDALVISTAEIAGRATERGLRSHAMHIGGKFDFEFGWIHLTPAFHGAGIPGGHACGALINFFGKIFYFAGDTGFFSDMKYLNRFGDVDYALLPIGDNYTMGINDAAFAASLIKPRITIPIHYKTWPVIDQDPNEFVRIIESKYTLTGLVVEPGSTIKFSD